MALPTWDDVVAMYPGETAFADINRIPTASQAAILAAAAAQCNATAWGALLNLGIIALAAHIAKLGLQRGGGTLTQEQLGQMSRSYASPQGLKGSLGLTAYGAEYQRLVRLLPSSIGACI